MLRRLGESASLPPLRAAMPGPGTTSGPHAAPCHQNRAADGAGADAQLLRHLAVVVQVASLVTGGGSERLAAHLDSGTSRDPGDGGSVDSEAFGDLLDGHPGCVGVEELLTLRVAQTSLRFECLGRDWAAPIASGGIVRVERRESASSADYG